MGGFGVKIKINQARKHVPNRQAENHQSRGGVPPGSAAAGWEWKSRKPSGWTLLFLGVRNASLAASLQIPVL